MCIERKKNERDSVETFNIQIYVCNQIMTYIHSKEHENCEFKKKRKFTKT